MNYKKLGLMLLLIFVFILGTSCGNPLQKKDSGKKETGSETKEQPKDLARLMSNVDEIFQKTSDLEKMQRTGQSPEGGTGGEQQKPGDQGKNSQQQGSQQNTQSSTETYTEVQGMESTGGGGKAGKSPGEQQEKGGQQGQPGGPQQGKEEDQSARMWEELVDEVQKLNSGWNSFEPKTEEDNVSADAIKGFEEELNRLTAAVRDKKLLESLTSANGLQKYISDLNMPYKETIPIGIYDVKYNYQEAYIKSVEGSWEYAGSEADKALDRWDQIATDMEKEDEELAKKMEFSLKDLQDAITTQDMNVVETKIGVIMENYRAFEKLFKDKEKEDKEKKAE